MLLLLGVHAAATEYLCKVLRESLELLPRAEQEGLAIFAKQALRASLVQQNTRRIPEQPADCLVKRSIVTCLPLPLCFVGARCKLLALLLLDAALYQVGEEAVPELCFVCCCLDLLQVLF